MDIKFLDLKKNYLSIKDEMEKEYNDLFDNCDFIHGNKVKIFENNFADYLNIKYFIGCANGTDALEIAVKSLELDKDDEIIVQGNTYIATCFGVINNNIKLVLCDIDQDTHMINIDSLKQKITQKTKAIIVVHLYGMMPNMDDIVKICFTNNIILIEDCAQAHGATWNNKKAGSFGKISCFSFYPGKNLGAYGDGGGIGTNDDLLNEKIRKISN
jgi:dTDP-4-amino-4,6-dideoxygalactose transaminase